MTYEKIKYYYDRGMWSADRVMKAVEKGVITEEEYKEIVGEVAE